MSWKVHRQLSRSLSKTVCSNICVSFIFLLKNSIKFPWIVSEISVHFFPAISLFSRFCTICWSQFPEIEMSRIKQNKKNSMCLIRYKNVLNDKISVNCEWFFRVFDSLFVWSLRFVYFIFAFRVNCEWNFCEFRSRRHFVI